MHRPHIRGTLCVKLKLGIIHCDLGGRCGPHKMVTFRGFMVCGNHHQKLVITMDANV